MVALMLSIWHPPPFFGTVAQAWYTYGSLLFRCAVVLDFVVACLPLCLVLEREEFHSGAGSSGRGRPILPKVWVPLLEGYAEFIKCSLDPQKELQDAQSHS